MSAGKAKRPAVREALGSIGRPVGEEGERVNPPLTFGRDPWGRRTSEHRDLDAYVLESAVRQGPWTVFARAERTDNDELTLAAGHHGPADTVGKGSLGAVRDFRLASHLAFGVGGLASANFVPRPLKALYGGDRSGFMGFVRLKVD
jgi:hypothetical protein